MKKVNKITKEQLEKITVSQKSLSDALLNIGVAEAQKHALLHQLADLNKSVEDFKAELEAEYGAININLEDGTYTKIEKVVE